MRKCRLTFEKSGKARYISHLDLMRVFRRAFNRAGVALQHSQGYNPHPLLSVVVPLPLFHESRCELLDVTLAEDFAFSGIIGKLNPCLPEGVRVLSAALPLRKPGEIAYLSATVELEYDRRVPDLSRLNGVDAVRTERGWCLNLKMLPLTINPQLAVEALEPDFMRICRTGFYDARGEAFK